MSYDVSLEVDAGGPDPVLAADFNHTSNTAGMWREAGCDIAAFDGKPATEFATALWTAITDMSARPGHYRQQDPPNGWGSSETCLEFLQNLHRACVAYPLATVRVCR